MNNERKERSGCRKALLNLRAAAKPGEDPIGDIALGKLRASSAMKTQARLMYVERENEKEN